MMSPLVKQHFQQPQYIGQLEEGENVYRIESNSASVGRHIIFFAEIVKDLIRQVRFQVRGCPYTIATFSFVAEQCTRQPMARLNQINRGYLIKTLGLPSTKVHCAAMAEDVLNQLQLNVKE